MIRQARNIALGLRPPLLDEAGLAPALDYHLKGLARRTGLAIGFDAIPGIERIPTGLNTTVFRVVQESVSNVLRHAQATQKASALPAPFRREVAVRGASCTARNWRGGGILALGDGIAGAGCRETLVAGVRPAREPASGRGFEWPILGREARGRRSPPGRSARGSGWSPVRPPRRPHRPRSATGARRPPRRRRRCPAGRRR